MHVSLMFPSDYLCAADLNEKDFPLTVESVTQKDLRMDDGSSEPKWIIAFVGATKTLVLNKTNAKMISSIHGTESEGWVGKEVTLFPTTCQSFGATVECIRVRGVHGGGLK